VRVGTKCAEHTSLAVGKCRWLGAGAGRTGFMILGEGQGKLYVWSDAYAKGGAGVRLRLTPLGAPAHHSTL
jgi:hypothetical protein